MTDSNLSELKALIVLLNDSDEVVKAAALDRLGELSEEAIPFLEQYWAQHPKDEYLLDVISVLQFNKLKNRLNEWKELFSDNLLMGIWIIATYKFPDLEYSWLKKKIYTIAQGALYLYDHKAHHYDKLRHLNHYLFNLYQFKPASNNFHQDRNSFLNQVLEQRSGNPISLCIIYKLVAEYLNIDLQGVNFPNLFLLSLQQGESKVYINAYAEGIILTQRDLELYLKQLQLPINPAYLEPCSNLDIIKRVLRNLIACYQYDQLKDKVSDMQQLLFLLTGEESPEFFPGADYEDEE